MTTTDPTPLAEQIAREHPPQKLPSRGYVTCATCDTTLSLAGYAAHIATVTERAVRERVAAEIRRAAYERALVVGESPFPDGSWHAGNDRGIGFGLDLAASIARGDAHA